MAISGTLSRASSLAEHRSWLPTRLLDGLCLHGKTRLEALTALFIFDGRDKLFTPRCIQHLDHLFPGKLCAGPRGILSPHFPCCSPCMEMGLGAVPSWLRRAQGHCKEPTVTIWGPGVQAEALHLTGHRCD